MININLPKNYIWDDGECWIDEVGGFHDTCIGTAPDGTFCGECYNSSCKDCFVWEKLKKEDKNNGK